MGTQMIRNILMDIYKEIRTYGNITFDMVNDEENSRTLIIHYEEAVYQIYLKNGEVIEISEISAY